MTFDLAWVSRRAAVPVMAAVLLASLLTVPPLTSSAEAVDTVALAPPWCGTPEPDAAANLPDGSEPGHPVGSFPHIPAYAVGCTLEALAAQSNGRITVEVVGHSTQGRPIHEVTIDALETRHQRQASQAWYRIRQAAISDPERGRSLLAQAGDRVKVPSIYQGGLHGNEFEGVDAIMELIRRLGTTPYGEDAQVDRILDHSIMSFIVDANPDGRVAGTRANAAGFDLNRDYLNQTQPEVVASTAWMRKWSSPVFIDLHGYLTPYLMGSYTKPHSASIDFDIFLRWNESRNDAAQAALAAHGWEMQRPGLDRCPNGSRPASGICPDGTPAGPAVAESWDNAAPVFSADYANYVGLDGTTAEMCSSTVQCGGRAGGRDQHIVVMLSALEFIEENRVEMVADLLELNRRGVYNEDRPECCPAPFDVDRNWMVEFPTAFVIPLGEGQRSGAEANRVVDWLLTNDVEVTVLTEDTTFDSQVFRAGSYVVWMTQSRRSMADTALSVGANISDRIERIYAPPAAWSIGYLWGADVVTIPRDAEFDAVTTGPITRSQRLPGGISEARTDAYALEIDSATAVRALNDLVDEGMVVSRTSEPFVAASGEELAAGSVVFPFDRSTRQILDRAGKDHGLSFEAVDLADLPDLDPIDRVPRIAVLATADNQDLWSLRNLGFPADTVSTATINSATEDPLLDYDVVFNTGGYPSTANATARARLQAFFARGGGYIGGGANGAAFLTTGAQVTGLSTANRSGNGRSGIVHWDNEGETESPITGVFPSRDTVIVDPPTWFTSIPATMTVDGRLPQTDILASGLWLTDDTQSASAAGAAIVAHGTNATGSARLVVFANNPLYRAMPERIWPAVAQAAYWSAG